MGFHVVLEAEAAGVPVSVARGTRRISDGKVRIGGTVAGLVGTQRPSIHFEALQTISIPFTSNFKLFQTTSNHFKPPHDNFQSTSNQLNQHRKAFRM